MFDPQNPSAILADFLAKFIPREAFSEIIARNNSFTFLCHETYRDTILKVSGKEGIFTKMHGVEDKDKLELLWLVFGRCHCHGREALYHSRFS